MIPCNAPRLRAQSDPATAAGETQASCEGESTSKLHRLPLLLLFALALALLPVAATATAGTIVADNGFRPAANGFSFRNYGDEASYANLNAAELQRLFGPAVCLPGRGRCVLNPVAKKLMRDINKDMAGGHCAGFANLSELIYKGYLPRFGYSKVSVFGAGVTSPFALELKGNELLQRTIARAFTLQVLDSVSEQTFKGTPNQVLKKLTGGGLDPSNPEILSLDIFQPGFKDGHEITPYAVESAGKGIFYIYVYDNNWPGEAGRRVSVDTNDDTWSYYAAVNPGVPQAEYAGNAKTRTLQLSPVRPGLGVQPCPICAGRRGLGSRYNEIRLAGSANEHAQVMITDAHGRRTGFVGNHLINQIPGARVLPQTSGGVMPRKNGGSFYVDSPAPVFEVPRGAEFEITLDGRRLRSRDRESLTLVGPTYDATLPNIVMGPGQIAHLRLSPRGNALVYASSRKTQVPAISLGAAARNVAYDITVSALGAPPGSGLTFVKQPKQQLMSIGDDTTERRTYRLVIHGENKAGEFSVSRRFMISGAQQAFLHYGPLASPKGTARIVIYGPRSKRPIRVLPINR